MTKQEIRNKIQGAWNWFLPYGFFGIIIFAFGFYEGIEWSKSTVKQRTEETIQLGGFVHTSVGKDGKPVSKTYDVKERL